ncbi:MAG TPA: alpha/beta fold hydrolase [Solirubrobacteraceae bacterium]|jgi:polyhydroxyalkanoate synthase|nr:alpha/beta fold hydrolase [Solirubrobacteraceae bacterium]
MALIPTPQDVLSRVRADVERETIRARNGIRVVTSTGRPPVGQSAKDVVWRRGRCELWRYRNENVRFTPPLFIVFSLVSRSYVLDLTPGNSFIEQLVGAGFDVFLLDWGVPDERDAHNLLEDYVLGYLPAAVSRACEVAGSDEVNMLGYCFGAVLALLYAAAVPGAALRSLTSAATPVDFNRMGPLYDLIRAGRIAINDVLDENGNVPPGVALNAFRTAHPVAELTQYVTLLDRLGSDRYIDAYQTMGRWAKDHIPFPGGVARQTAQMLIRDNALITDRLMLDGRAVHLTDISCPFLAVLANRDTVVPEPAAAPLIGLVGSPEREELRLDAGHVGLFVGRTAAKTTVPRIIDFLQRRSQHAQAVAGDGERA